MKQKMGWLSVYAYTERKGAAVRYRWRVCGWDGTVLTRSAANFASEGAAYASADRASRLLDSVFALRRKRAAA